jgi:hypothetical protein
MKNKTQTQMPTSKTNKTPKRKGEWTVPSRKSARNNKSQVIPSKEAVDEQHVPSTDTETTPFVVTVRFLDSAACSVNVSENSTVRQIKKSVVESKGCPAACLKIFSPDEEKPLKINQTGENIFKGFSPYSWFLSSPCSWFLWYH